MQIGGPEMSDIINSTHSILYPIFMSLVVFFNKAVNSGLLTVQTTESLLYKKVLKRQN